MTNIYADSDFIDADMDYDGDTWSVVMERYDDGRIECVCSGIVKTSLGMAEAEHSFDEDSIPAQVEEWFTDQWDRGNTIRKRGHEETDDTRYCY